MAKQVLSVVSLLLVLLVHSIKPDNPEARLDVLNKPGSFFQMFMEERKARTALETRVEEQETINQEVQEKLSLLSEQVKSLTQERSCQLVAFNAYLTSTTTGVRGVPVKFNEVVVNRGEAYNPKLGVFKAPVDGIYVFSMDFGTPKNAYMWLKKGGHPRNFAWVHGNSAKSGSTTVVEMQKNENAWVETNAVIFGYYAPDGRIHTSFSGFLLKEL